MRALATQGLGVLVVLHDPNLALRYASQVTLIGNGRDRGAATSWNGIAGWSWLSSRSLRWGVNRLTQSGQTIVLGGSTVRSLSFDFDQGAPGHEAVAVTGDSGGPVFVGGAADSELAGLMFANHSYQGQPAATSLFGNGTLAADLSYYRGAILAVTSERACADGSDDDGDGLVDTADPGCLDAGDAFETNALVPCDDGFDDDGDGLIDYPDDPGCRDPQWLYEDPKCDDGLDNDGDGKVDFPDQYPGCISANDPIEAAQCGDGVDNDGDLAIDFPADTGCTAANGQSESPVNVFAGGLFAVDRASRAVFRVDTVSGTQTLVSQGARLTAPQGIAARVGELVVADPAGLVAVSGTGVQRLASPPLAAGESLQVVLDPALDAYVLEASAVSKVLWNPFGLGAKSAFLPIPTPEPIPTLSNWNGDALAIEANGNLLVAGLSLLGDGVFRVTNPGAAVSILKIGFDHVKWLDLALEANGTIVAVGTDLDVDTGVFRINPSTGVISTLNIAFAWQTPTGVAVAPDGMIYVGDAGSCTGGTCTGGKIVRVDNVSGAATQISSGGLISGELDLVALPEPAASATWLAGIAALLALRRRRDSRRLR